MGHRVKIGKGSGEALRGGNGDLFVLLVFSFFFFFSSLTAVPSEKKQ